MVAQWFLVARCMVEECWSLVGGGGSLVQDFWLIRWLVADNWFGYGGSLV
jgi:hypothetical protein